MKARELENSKRFANYKEKQYMKKFSICMIEGGLDSEWGDAVLSINAEEATKIEKHLSRGQRVWSKFTVSSSFVSLCHLQSKQANSLFAYNSSTICQTFYFPSSQQPSLQHTIYIIYLIPCDDSLHFCLYFSLLVLSYLLASYMSSILYLIFWYLRIYVTYETFFNLMIYSCEYLVFFGVNKG